MYWHQPSDVQRIPIERLRLRSERHNNLYSRVERDQRLKHLLEEFCKSSKPQTHHFPSGEMSLRRLKLESLRG
jgi:hypothetical protein